MHGFRKNIFKNFTSLTVMKLITFEEQSNDYGYQTACNVKVLKLTTLDYFYDLDIIFIQLFGK